MPAFVCDRCGCVDNTALGEYWFNHYKSEDVLCTECATGEWHGHWEKKEWDGEQNVVNR